VQTVWHRLYLEAVIPPKSGIRVFLAATNQRSDLDELQESDWYEHRFGQRFAPGVLRADDPPFDRQIPLGAWVSQASEIPYHSGLLGCPIQQNQQGLFTALIQRAGRQVRSLQGRYLWVRLELKGDGHNTPEIAALRAYASRFSYLNQYLPALYQESRFGPDADEPGTSTPADFLERFLDNFEGILTPLEDRIGRADLLTDARTVPAESLDWLGSWVGVTFEPGYPVARRRRLLQAAPQIHRQRGTLNGLKQALDIASDGGVQGGEIVVLEDFRLRRTFATILGADLADTTNPLTAGLSVSGNSFVGDTLVLGDEAQREFLALFQADLPLDNLQDQAAVANFFDRLAYRVTIYVHNEVTPQDLGLIRRIAELESPAHILTRVVTTTAPFLVTLSALVGLDTYLSPEPPRQTVTLDRSHLSVHDVLQQPASLDPRLTGSFNGDLRYPLARAEVDSSPLVGESFILDGRNSQAFAGRRINRYRWTLEDDPGG
ncbi:MAG: phage tail protein, partial [Nodosilinea sp.]